MSIPLPRTFSKKWTAKKNEAVQIPEGESEEGPVGPVVVEDRFPRIDDRTTMTIEVLVLYSTIFN
ncbi:hypothetical protein KIN20_035256 [Parelaphostrongylus tenuis]|uniref:Uncharacterized protein n=1 Tax=Parelaphostrongylus tenuis TaxID=148309 RepID=A0AAD5RE20_PARTN|nr:hypothetical protein KIN20_035256 [Parelaphostrongylus tenuis]